MLLFLPNPAGTTGGIELVLAGVSRTTNPQPILQAPDAASNKRVSIKAADGEKRDDI